MRVRLVCKPECYQKYLIELTEHGIEVSDDADLFLCETLLKENKIVGKVDGDIVIIKPKNIIYIQSYDHDIECVTITGTYNIKQKLYKIEEMFYDVGFLRVNKSCVINTKHIKKIKLSYNMKFILVMNNDEKIDVTRSYYNKFKKYIGI